MFNLRKKRFKEIGVIADTSRKASKALEALCDKYDVVNLGDTDLASARKKVDVIGALGGDGFMLRTLHEFIGDDIPFYGLNCGSVGFLMNVYGEDNLLARLDKAVETQVRPLRMKATCAKGMEHEALAINEVSLLRQTRQTAAIRISIEDKVQMQELMCDGVLLSTPAGSSAYNYASNGPILPLSANLLALTPISAFRPRRWKGALLPHDLEVKFDILHSYKRPVSAVADFTEIRDVISVSVREEKTKRITLLFDPESSLEERILKEQFVI
jgi:NAD+ kinase